MSFHSLSNVKRSPCNNSNLSSSQSRFSGPHLLSSYLNPNVRKVICSQWRRCSGRESKKQIKRFLTTFSKVNKLSYNNKIKIALQSSLGPISHRLSHAVSSSIISPVMMNSCKWVPTCPRVPTMVEEILKTSFMLCKGVSSHPSNLQDGRSPSRVQLYPKHFSNSKIWSSKLNSDSQKERYLRTNNNITTLIQTKSLTLRRSNRTLAGPQ